MGCWREKVLREASTHCQEMEARVCDLEDGGQSCFCLGVIDLGYRSSPEYSKRFCIADTDRVLDIGLDLTDVDVAALQATLSGGMLAIYQRAKSVRAEK